MVCGVSALLSTVCGRALPVSWVAPVITNDNDRDPRALGRECRSLPNHALSRPHRFNLFTLLFCGCKVSDFR